MILFVQPIVYSYRLAVINAIASQRNISVLAGFSACKPTCDYTYIKNSLSPKWIYIFFCKFFIYGRSLKLFLPACTAHTGILSIAIFSRLLGLKVVVHGQALLKKPTPNIIDLIISKFWLLVSSKYIAYSNIGLIGPFEKSNRVQVVLNRYESPDSLNVLSIDTQSILIKKLSSLFWCLIYRQDRHSSEISLLVSAIMALKSLERKLNCISWGLRGTQMMS